MIQEVQAKARELLQEQKIQAFLGLKQRHGQICPHLFQEPQELNALHLGDLQQPGDSRYPLLKSLQAICQAYPGQKIGVLVRGCDQRGLNALQVWKQIDLEQVVQVGICCPQELADACQCHKPYPEQAVAGEPAQPREFESVARLEDQELQERFQTWMFEFSKCVKCYGCRDICPMCFCKECSLEDETLVQTGNLPPEIPIFHWVRAAHMAGRCIDCGLCEQACPADIPLRTLYKKVEQILNQEFDYHTGADAEHKSPLNLIQN